jgi:hypothetical protein
MSYQDADAIVLLKLCQQQVDSVAAPELPVRPLTTLREYSS